MDIRRFLGELKGRGVYRVAALYAAGSWALLQVADIFFPILGFPDWAITTVLAFSAVGFPMALILAWVFEITPEGLRREFEVDPDASITRETGRKLLLFTLLILLTIMALTLIRFLLD